MGQQFGLLKKKIIKFLIKLADVTNDKIYNTSNL